MVSVRVVPGADRSIAARGKGVVVLSHVAIDVMLLELRYRDLHLRPVAADRQSRLDLGARARILGEATVRLVEPGEVPVALLSRLGPDGLDLRGR